MARHLASFIMKISQWQLSPWDKYQSFPQYQCFPRAEPQQPPTRSLFFKLPAPLNSATLRTKLPTHEPLGDNAFQRIAYLPWLCLQCIHWWFWWDFTHLHSTANATPTNCPHSLGKVIWTLWTSTGPVWEMKGLHEAWRTWWTGSCKRAVSSTAF